MGSWTYNQFVERLQFQMGQDTSLQTANLANSGATNMYGIWINAAYHDITERNKFWKLRKRFYFPELETNETKTTTDGQAYIAYPTNCYYPQFLYDSTNNHYIKWRPWEWYIKKTDRSDTSKEGEPDYWTRRATSGTQYIYLYPTPDTTNENIVVYYRRKVVDISGSTATLIGDEWDEPILLLAMIKGNMWMNNWDVIGKIKDEFIEMVADRAEAYTPEEQSRGEYFRPDPAYHQIIRK